MVSKEEDDIYYYPIAGELMLQYWTESTKPRDPRELEQEPSAYLHSD